MYEDGITMKLATIGTSWICKKFVAAAKETKKYEHVAIYSRKQETGVHFSKAVESLSATVYTDLELMAQQNDIDVVYIASPNAFHLNQVLTCLKHKKHVICEKPIFTNCKELDIAFKCAEENGVFLFEAIKNMYDPNFEILKQTVSNLGNVRQVSLHFNRSSARFVDLFNGNNDAESSNELSSGALMDVGIYPLYTAVGLFGAPNSVRYQAVVKSGVDMSGVLLMEYSRFVCVISNSKLSTSFHKNEIQTQDTTIVFESGSSYHPIKIVDLASKSEQAVRQVEVENNLFPEANAFADFIERKDNKKYLAGKVMSRTVLKIIEECRKQNGIIYPSD